MTVTLSSAGGGSSVPNWQLLSTNAPSGVATVTFGSLAGYSKYRIMAPNIGTAATCSFNFRVNGDTGFNYYWSQRAQNGATLSGTGSSGTAHSIDAANAQGRQVLSVEIDGALILTPKQINSESSVLVGVMTSTFGQYLSASLITSLSLVLTSSSFNAGTIYLLGAN